ncbi:MAG: GTP cyclohydrolase II [Chloroflexi bacterium]|nr:GTP cyclohydrolase II [Chloroflexota bacterium]
MRIAAIADLPTRFGDFQIVAFRNNRDNKEHVAIVHGDVCGGEEVLTRLHSECLTGDALGSLRCDCRDQLQSSLETIAAEKQGIVLYLRQEGRGIGLVNKIRAYGLQDHGLDTVEANLALGFRDDEREYGVAAHMLASLKVKSIRLMTNNPRKIEDLEKHGVKVTERVPHVLPPNKHNAFYLKTKATKSGHFIDLNGYKHLMEQDDRPILQGMDEDQIKVVESQTAPKSSNGSEAG